MIEERPAPGLRQRCWDMLLHWCAERGSGPWPLLRDACRSLCLPPAESVYRLAALGHVEIGVSRRSWAATSPALVELEAPAGRLLLTGAVTAGLAGEIDAILAKHGIDAAVLGPFAHDARAPSTVHVEADPSLWPDIERHTGLPVVPALARRLARRLPPADAEVIGVPHTPDDRLAVAPIDPVTLEPAWGQSLEPGLATVEVRPGRQLVWWVRDSAGRARRLPSAEWAPYLTRREGLSPLVRYDRARSVLSVDAAAPLPPLHVRAACLCSGRFASRAHLAPGQAEDRFRGVPPVVAHAICSSLGQGEET